jgi:SAM-dependent methyltransferase
MHDSSFARMKDLVDAHLGNRRGERLRVLDVGSYDVNGSYRALFDEPYWDYVGLDVAPGRGVDVAIGRLYRWGEIASRSVDIVISGQAFEHIEFPWVSILEVARVLRPGGLLILIVPSSGPEHRYPLDCWRFYPDGITALAHWADLDVVMARTHWQDEGWAEGDQWHDTILVARKAPDRQSLLSVGKQRLLRFVTSLQAQRRQLDVSSAQEASPLGAPAQR